MSLCATRTPTRSAQRVIVPCARCGIERQSGSNTAVLRRQCTAVLNPAERAVWAA